MELPNKPDLGEAAGQEHVYRSQIHDVDQLKSRLIEEWEHFQQVFIDEAIRQWHPRLQACIRAHGGHFEHRLWLSLVFIQTYTLTVTFLCCCL